MIPGLVRLGLPASGPGGRRGRCGAEDPEQGLAYITDMMTQGFVPADDHSRNMLMQKGVAVASAASPEPEPETRILISAQEKGGVLTVSGVSLDAGLQPHGGEGGGELDALVEAGDVELRSGRSGGPVYATWCRSCSPTSRANQSSRCCRRPSLLRLLRILLD